jgi:hypothetical protein
MLRDGDFKMWTVFNINRQKFVWSNPRGGFGFLQHTTFHKKADIYSKRTAHSLAEQWSYDNNIYIPVNIGRRTKKEKRFSPYLA